MHNTNKRGVCAKKARNARWRRLKIRRMSTGVKQPSHFDQMLSVGEENGACSGAKKRNFDSKSKVEEATSPEGPRDADVPGKDKKLKGVAGNTRSNHLCLLNSDSTAGTSRGHSGDGLSEEEVVGKEEVGKVEDFGSMTRLNCGSISVIGRRRAMEDALTVAPGMVAEEYEFFAAYDGHGGARVANACRDRLHHLLEIELKQNSRAHEKRVDWNKVMKVCFAKMDEEVLTDHRVIGVEVEELEKAVGSTAVVVMVGSEELVVANCGDSRAVLSRGGVAVPLSKDHKPDRPDEKERVEAAGGRIINWDGSRIQGVLAMSRSIGDHYLKPYVISEPEVTVNKRTDSDDFLIIATDGLWDVISNGVACEIVRRCLNGRISKRLSKDSGSARAAVLLAEVAIAKGSRDNISIIVVDLKKASSKGETTQV